MSFRINLEGEMYDLVVSRVDSAQRLRDSDSCIATIFRDTAFPRPQGAEYLLVNQPINIAFN